MKMILCDQIREAITEMCQRANFDLAADMRSALQAAVPREDNPLPKNTLLRILRNADVAKERSLPMCQDTGLIVVFADLGNEIQIKGGNLRDAINSGVREGWRKGFLRPSVTADPIQRKNTGDNTPAIIHTELVAGDNLRLQLLAKGGGMREYEPVQNVDTRRRT